MAANVRIEASPDFAADTVLVLDAGGAELWLRRNEHDAIYVDRKAPLVEGKQTLTVSDTATTIVFRRGDEELARMPLELERGDVTYVRP